MARDEPRTAKRILTFQPSGLRRLSDCEAHYLRVHRRWAVAALGEEERLLGYVTTRMDAQWDMAGGFGRVPDLWRYAEMRFVPPGVEFDPGVARMLAEDHQNFLKDLRRFDVAESVAFDRPSARLTSAKYVVLLDRPAAASPGEEPAASAGRFVDGLTALLRQAYGARRMVVNRVERERENLPLRESGQLPTGRVLPSTDRLLHLELYFDDADWGDAFFAGAPMLDLFRSSPFAPAAMTAYRASERVAHDRDRESA